jgi:hypothetical protein
LKLNQELCKMSFQEAEVVVQKVLTEIEISKESD